MSIVTQYSAPSSADDDIILTLEREDDGSVTLCVGAGCATLALTHLRGEESHYAEAVIAWLPDPDEVTARDLLMVAAYCDDGILPLPLQPRHAD